MPIKGHVMTNVRLTALVVLCAATLAGAACAKRTQPVAPSAPPAAPPVAANAPPPAPPAPSAAPMPQPPPPSLPAAALTEEELFQRKTLDQLNAERPLGDVFFDLDASMVRDDARVVLQQNAEWLRRWTSTRITIEGHGDERGTNEYNLALGERRANAAYDYLAILGVSRDRITVVSKGEEAPFCAEPYEECWQQNRRGRFVITAK
jgi:peptidoglycan-associated lipoprotein